MSPGIYEITESNTDSSPLEKALDSFKNVNGRSAYHIYAPQKIIDDLEKHFFLKQKVEQECKLYRNNLGENYIILI